MSQFRPLPSFRSNDVPAVTEESSNTAPFASPLPSPTTTTATTTDTTNRLPFPMLTTGQLAIFTGSLPAAATGRYLRIPGTVKREPVTEKLPRSARRMSARLRHALIFFVVFFVVLTTLLSLSPLDNGQSNIPLIGSISDWVHSQQLNWQLQAQIVQVAQVKPKQSTSVTQNNAALPPIPLPTSTYVAIARQDAINVGISPDYFTRQIYLESGFNPNAYSPAGAEGIAQFEPGTAAGLGINPWNPIQALQGAARLMASYNSNYGGNYAMALAAYNGGSGTVQYAVNACGSSAWMNCLPPETRHYIYEIMGI